MYLFLAHLAEKLLQVECLGRGILRWQYLIADPILNGTHQSRLASCRHQNPIDQRGCRGLAFCPRHPDHIHGLGWPPIEPNRHARHCRQRAFHLDDAHSLRNLLDFFFDHRQHCPGLCGLRNEVMSVKGASGHRYKRTARSYLSRIILDGCDLLAIAFPYHLIGDILHECLPIHESSLPMKNRRSRSSLRLS